MNKTCVKMAFMPLTILIVSLCAAESFCQSENAPQNRTKDLFLPIPKQIEYVGETFEPQPEQFIFLNSAVDDAMLAIAEHFKGSLQIVGFGWQLTAAEVGQDSRTGLSLSIDPITMPRPQGYHLKIHAKKISIVAHDKAGAFYAAQTFRQLCLQHRESKKLPCMEIQDWPDFPNRGVLLDITRDKVPTMKTLYELVDMLASCKVNQLQLYTEHAFAYRNHEVVWQNASPMTGEEILRLDRYCRQRFVELVPNQNSFAHMKRWLNLEPYRKLAECPNDTNTPQGIIKCFGICPIDPNSLKLLDELYSELLPHFTSGFFNVGCDETFDLGYGRSKEICSKIGVGRVYLEYLLKINQLCQKNGKIMQFWGDIVLSYPELIPDLPKDIVALVWGYEANDPNDENCEQFSKHNIPFYVCPGTSSWRSIGGRTNNAIRNMTNAAENGIKYGAKGFLVTDWGDYGHWQPLSVSIVPLAYAAGVSWSFEKNKDVNLPDVTDFFIFKDQTGSLGQAFYDLGNIAPEGLTANQSVLFYILRHPNIKKETFPLSHITAEQLQGAIKRIDIISKAVDKVEICGDDSRLTRDEFRFAARFLRHACRLGILRLQQGDDSYEKLAVDIQQIMEEHRRLWLLRNRSGGLDDSLAKMQNLLNFYEQNKDPVRSKK